MKYLIFIFLTNCTTTKNLDLDVTLNPSDRKKINVSELKMDTSEPKEQKDKNTLTATIISDLFDINAEKKLLKALSNDSSDQKALLNLSKFYLQKNNTENAFEYLGLLKESFEEKRPDPKFLFEYRYVLALFYNKNKKTLKAKEIFTDLIILDDTFIPSYLALASIYLNDGKLEACDLILKRALQKKEQDPDIFNFLGILEEAKAKNEVALKYYDKALELAADHQGALINKSSIMLQYGDFDKAQELLNTAYKLNPNNSELFLAFGNLRRQKREDKEASNYYSKALEIDSNNVTARFFSGLNQMDLKNYQRALIFFHEVMQTTKKDSKLFASANYYYNELKNFNAL